MMGLFAKGALFGLALAAEAALGAKVWVVAIDGEISPAWADYFVRAVERAATQDVDLVVLRLDTPGGLDKSMRAMIKAILASPVPVATYVAPSGARAASAGTYIMYASHIAAMAPATSIGASTPVSIGGGSPLPIPGWPDEAEDPAAEEAEEEVETPRPPAGTAMERKVVNDAVAYIKGLAALRGRNAEWAEKTVREAASLTAEEALAEGVVDVLAEDLDALLAAVDGRVVDAAGVPLTVAAAGATVEPIEPDWRYRLLGVITSPNVAYILLMIGIYGLILDFYSPGIGVGAVAGVICLLLAAFALQMLPINYAGAALLVVGIGLLVAEAFSPSFGLFGVGGAVAFVAGSIFLMDTDLPAYQISRPVIWGVTVVSVLVLVFTLGAAARARRQRVATGKEGMLGSRALVIEAFSGEGRVRAGGEIWQARGAEGVAFAANERVTIKGFEGLRVLVEPEQRRA